MLETVKIKYRFVTERLLKIFLLILSKFRNFFLNDSLVLENLVRFSKFNNYFCFCIPVKSFVYFFVSFV